MSAEKSATSSAQLYVDHRINRPSDPPERPLGNTASIPSVYARPWPLYASPPSLPCEIEHRITTL
eukprot:2558298-Prymnesium_polylepis.1